MIKKKICSSMKIWQEYVSELFDDCRNDTYDIIKNGEESDILESEITKTMQCMKTRKSSGVDEINTKIPKALDGANTNRSPSSVIKHIYVYQVHKLQQYLET